MSDANRVSLGIIREIAKGVTPATPAFQTLRYTGAPSLAFNPITVQSNEIRSDANITDLILVGAEAGGDTAHELSYGALSVLIEAVMRNTWTLQNNRLGSDVTDITTQVITVLTGAVFAVNDLIYLTGFGDANDEIIFPAVAVTDDTTITAAAGLIDNAAPGALAEVRKVGVQAAAGDIDSTVGPNGLTSTILDFTAQGFIVGDWIKIGGALALNQLPTAENNDWVRISSISTNALLFDVVPTGWVSDASVAELVWLFYGDRIRNGTDKLFHSLEQAFQDHTPISYQYFVGMMVNTLVFTLAQESIVTSTASFLGFNASATTTRIVGATDIAAPTNTLYNTSSNIGRIGRGPAGEIVDPNCLLDVTLNLNSNLRRINCIGTLGSVDVGLGQFSYSGSLNAYFGDLSLLQDVLNNTERGLDLRFQDNQNKVLLFDSPRTKYSSGAPTVAGINQDVLINVGFQALLDSSGLFALQIQRFHKVQ